MKRAVNIFALSLWIVLQGCSGLVPARFPVASDVPAVTTPLNDTVLFIGDSITAGWPEVDFKDHKNWINKGIGGQTSKQIAARFQVDVVDLHPGLVHILVGTNDVYPGWEICGSKTPYVASATIPPGTSDTCANVFYMLETAKRNKIKAVIGTIPPWGCSDAQTACSQPTADLTPGRYVRIGALNSWIRTFGLEEGAVVVDYHAALTNANGLYASGLTLDGVHPSAAGYGIIKPIAEAAFR
jgi:lysophospholipase L1-like esterase